jgi:hypothetical protein
VIKKYRVVFLGLLETTEGFKRRMSQLGVPAEKVEGLIEKAPIIMKRDITLREARRYADAVQEAGGRVIIEEHGHVEEPRHANRPVSIAPLEDFTMCPECGLKQAKGKTCVKCGFTLTNKSSNV